MKACDLSHRIKTKKKTENRDEPLKHKTGIQNYESQQERLIVNKRLWGVITP